MTADTIESPQRRDTAGYRYQHGDRPLDGYVIQRGAGRGGFGEVYYALSDSGREVALKVVHTYEQIELRGIGQCMNLKSPHLVTVFDVKYGDDGRPWVIMEFVNGPSLRELLDAAPAGLGVQKAAFFLREIGKGLSELHDCGIVHRDLKPANIFFENGYVKIGDYGLSKLISASQHSAQTMTVGTVHYMAPEIGAGRYNKGIDIYAMGALLFEMLTGQVPYLGSSPAEVLMKHVNGTVDLSGIEEPFASVIRKAMARNPEERYASVQEMVEGVFGADHVRNSVSQFSPDSLTMVAGQAARKISPMHDGSFTPSDTPVSFASPRMDFNAPFDRLKERCGRVEGRARDKWARANERLGRMFPPAGDLFQKPKLDPMSLGQRIAIGSVVGAMVAIVATIVDGHGPKSLFFVLLSIGGATTALMLAWRLIAPSLRHESRWLVRLLLGGSAGIVVAVLTSPFWSARGGHHGYANTAMAVLVGLLILDWPAHVSANRRERVSRWRVVIAFIAALVLSGMFEGNPVLAIAAVAGTALVAGLVAGWNPTALRPVPRPPTPGAGMAPIMSPPTVPPIPSAMAAPAMTPAAPVEPPSARVRHVPAGVRALWLVLFIGCATLGLTQLALALFGDSLNHHGAVFFGFGIGLCAVAAFCYRRSTVTQFAGWWGYVARPLLLLGCIQALLVFGSLIFESQFEEGGDALPPLLASIFPAVLLFVLKVHTRPGGAMSYSSAIMPAALARSAPRQITLAGIGFGVVRLVSLLAGLIVLFASLLLTAAVVSNLPGLWTSPIVDPQFSHEMAREFGTREWPSLIRHLGGAADFVLAMIATALLLIPRRGAGAFHVFRGLLAIGLAFAAAIAFGHALPDWSEFIPGNTPPATIEIIFQSIRVPGMLVAAGLIVLAGFVFLLPPRARLSTKA